MASVAFPELNMDQEWECNNRHRLASLPVLPRYRLRGSSTIKRWPLMFTFPEPNTSLSDVECPLSVDS